MKTLHIYPTGAGYHITVGAVLAFLFGISISNSAYFSRISETPNVTVSNGTLVTMTALNSLLAVLSGLLLLWTIYRVIVSHESKHSTIHDEYIKMHSDLGNQHKSHNHHHHHHHPPPLNAHAPKGVHNIHHYHGSKPSLSPALPEVF